MLFFLAYSTDKVGTVIVARLIYERTMLVISLNVVYSLMFINDSTKHMSVCECAHNIT
jgi:hypothetical protein